MRILLHSNAPFVMTGYGQQCALWAKKLAGLGHKVAISAFYGLQGAAMEWEGIRVYPGGLNHHGNDVLPGHAKDFGADLVIILTDCWVMDPELVKSLNAACWMPVDCAPLGVYDRNFLDAAETVPVAMSQFGHDVLARAGHSPLYVPHGIDAAQTFIPQDRDKCRDLLGLPSGAFITGINAANKDPERKGFAEQLMAFAMFRETHPDALLLLHTTAQGVGDGIDLSAMAARLDLTGSVRFSSQYKYVTGGYTPADMAAWYGCLDVYSGAALAEGFGLPLAEAQACGIPVITTDASAMTELCGAGWLVQGEPYWNRGHLAPWCRPHVQEIADAYEAAVTEASGMADKAREFALRYDADRVLHEHWVPALEKLAP